VGCGARGADLPLLFFCGPRGGGGGGDGVGTPEQRNQSPKGRFLEVLGPIFFLLEMPEEESLRKKDLEHILALV